MTYLIPTRIDLDSRTESQRTALVVRSAVPDANVRSSAAQIVENVRVRGDAALSEYASRFGGGSSDDRLAVSTDDMEQAFLEAPADFIDAIKDAATSITAVHEQQLPKTITIEPKPGVSIEREWTALKRVGVYVPGGGAAYPSSLLMSVIPAQVAGIKEIAVACPASPQGTVDASVLCAAHMLGVTEMYAMGGAQAIGALAYGTETIPRVDKIVGPGGSWVTAAKLAVYGTVGVDLPAGPSEAAIVVDATTDPAIAASDLLCQAEHGPDSVVMLIGTHDQVLDDVLRAASSQLEKLERRTIISSALTDHGLIVKAPSMAAALSFVDDWAPEHVSILTEKPRLDAASVTSAGSVLLGRWTPESAGDYATGANHILPTGGLARAYGPLSTEDFGSWRQVQELTEAGLGSLAPTIRALAEREGLSAHAACVDVRLEQLTTGVSQP